MMDKNVANDDGDSSKLDVTTTAEHRKRNLRWQKIHVVFLMIAFLCSLAGILAFGLVVKNFEAFCPLFASNISVRLDDDGKAYVFDDWNSTWGSKATCDYCLFTTVASFVYAFLWLWIFCSFSKTMEAISAK